MTVRLRRRSRTRRSEEIGSSRFSATDLVSESVAGILQRPGRSALTMLGTVLGIGAFVTILGLSETAGGQVSKQFSVLDATQVAVADVGDVGTPPTYDFPDAADQMIERLNGVVAAGVWWQVPGSPSVSMLPGAARTAGDLAVYAVTPGLIQASGPVVSAGVLLNDFDESRHQPVAVISAATAGELGISNLQNEPAVFIGGQPFTVVGVVATDQRLPQLGFGIMIPATTARAIWGAPPANAPASMLIHTRLGAAQLIARQAPVALRPDDPGLLSAAAPLNPDQLRQAVTGNLNTLFLALASVALVIGAVGIANTTLVAILERTTEIGLRRALGARRRHIASQFLTESTTLGLLGGTIGAALGVLTTLAVAVQRSWTAVLNPFVVVVAPLVGALVGLLAGLYPSLRAAVIEPAEALRR